jgi:hypothetical protein
MGSPDKAIWLFPSCHSQPAPALSSAMSTNASSGGLGVHYKTLAFLFVFCFFFAEELIDLRLHVKKHVTSVSVIEQQVPASGRNVAIREPLDSVEPSLPSPPPRPPRSPRGAAASEATSGPAEEGASDASGAQDAADAADASGVAEVGDVGAPLISHSHEEPAGDVGVGARAPPPVADALSPEEIGAASEVLIAAAFAVASQVRKMSREVAARCAPCHAPRLAKHRELYLDPARVLAIDANVGFGGLGNALPRWANLLKLAETTQWATYFDFHGCGAGTGREYGGTGGECRFDPAAYFRGDGFDWRWNPAREREFDAVFEPRGIKLRTFYYKCRTHPRGLCQITPDGFVEDARSHELQAIAVASNGYGVGSDGVETQNDGWIHEWLATPEMRDARYVKLAMKRTVDLQSEATKSTVRCGRRVTPPVVSAKRAGQFFSPHRFRF